MYWIFFFFFAILHAEDDLSSITRTFHEIRLNDARLPYIAVTGKLPLDRFFIEEEGNSPEIFFIAYFLEDEEEEQRPITFIFPGGPGGSCGPESICSFGPRRILTPLEGKSILPPYQIIDNPETLLPWTDLVFVDPIGTGFSSLAHDENTAQRLFSVDGDIASLGEFIRIFIAYFNRWNSPKYLSGISYGTTRCCGLAEYLTSHDLSLHGLILLGSAIDFSTLVGQHNRALPDSLLIPTFAATAWYHGKLDRKWTLQEVIEKAKRFTFETYIPNELQPHRKTAADRDLFYQDLSSLIGLSLETTKRYQGRFDEFLYTTEFFGSERKVIGGLDTRYVGDLYSIQRQDGSDDPSYNDMQGLYCAFNHYLHNELETIKPFERYVTFSAPVNAFWNYQTRDSCEWPELIQRVRRTLIQNPCMQIFVGNGYYDCRTPFAATEYCFDHLNLPASYDDNLHFEYYEAGHGFIFDHHCLKKLQQDLRSFYSK